MAILNDIRACLDNHLLTTPSLPPIAHQNVKFSPSNGQTYLKVDFMPNTRRPAVRGPNPQQFHQGLYRILVCTPENVGTGDNLEIVDTLLSRFDATTDISYGGKIVSIDYAEVGVSFLDAPFYCTPVFVAWYIYN